MANQLFVNPFPYGVDNTQRFMYLEGSIALCGSATATGEPINWGNILQGIPYQEKNFAGRGGSITSGTPNSGSALVTTYAAAAGTVTATANNNFYVGQRVKFLGNTSVLGLLLNGTIATVVTATPTQFTFLSSAVGTGTAEVGMAVNAKALSLPLAMVGPTLLAPITAVSAAGGIITVTAANLFLPGAGVQFISGTGALLTALVASGLTYTVLSTTGAAFTIASALTGATGTGSATGNNPPQPLTVEFQSQGDSGYLYSYTEVTGSLFVQVGAAAISLPAANLAAGVYPAGVLGDIIKYSAKFAKQK
jgi:hypothetical protein